MCFISKVQPGPLKISSVSEVMKESKLPASQFQKHKADTPASTAGTAVCLEPSFKNYGQLAVLVYLSRGGSLGMKDSAGPSAHLSS